MKLKWGEINSNGADVHLEINFNEQQKKFLKIGKIWFGLKSGELCLNINNGKIPYEDRALKSHLEIKYDTTREIKSIKTKKDSSELAGDLGSSIKEMKPTISAKITPKSGKSIEGTEQIQETFPYTKWQITTKGSEKEPIWCFKCATNIILNGTLQNEKLGTVRLSEKYCSLQAEFKVSMRDIVITNCEWIFPIEISENKKSIIKLIILRYLANELNPYLSRQVLEFDDGKRH